MSETGVVRISVSIPPLLLKELDTALTRMGYESRSKAIHDAIRNFVAEYKWIEEKGSCIGAITMVYDHGKCGLLKDLTKIQHNYEAIISSATHIHLDERNCLEIIAVRGDTVKIRTLTQALVTKKGVKQLKLSIVAP
jgi:CopG family nickel-responsive transcriptional regulator